MNVNRLKKLADFLQTIPKKLFKMEHWVTTEGDEDVTSHIHKPEATECGFAGCAMGWACQMPAFRKAGLKLKPGDQLSNWMPYPSFADCNGYDAAEEFFGIMGNESNELFWANSYSEDPDRWNKITPQQVAKRIYKLIEKHQKKKVDA